MSNRIALFETKLSRALGVEADGLTVDEMLDALLEKYYKLVTEKRESTYGIKMKSSDSQKKPD